MALCIPCKWGALKPGEIRSTCLLTCLRGSLYSLRMGQHRLTEARRCITCSPCRNTGARNYLHCRMGASSSNKCMGAHRRWRRRSRAGLITLHLSLTQSMKHTQANTPGSCREGG